MKKSYAVKPLVLALGFLVSLEAQSFEHFITRSGSVLLDGDQPLRFAGVQAPELHRIEDDARGVCAADPRGWGQYFKWPTAEEQENWFQSLAFTGHKVMRTYVLSIEQDADAACGRETHVLKPPPGSDVPRLNEVAMVNYDRMIALADKYNIRLILPIVDHWPWWGGREQLADFYGEQDADFYRTDSKTYIAYQQIIKQLILRKNTLTGRLYRDEKAIMAWETGNELKGTTSQFLQRTAAFIKQLDPNHLVMDGNYIKVERFAVEDPNVDIISNHYYENVGNLKPENVLADLQQVQGKKAYIIGEFGLLNIERLQAIAEQAITRKVDGSQVSGFFIWGLRGHRHNGGYYWHLEPANNKTYSYHIPGFAEGDANQERQVIDLVRMSIARMNGENKMIPLPVPLPPVLREVENRADIRWLGAAVGRYYRVERATSAQGPWQVIGNKISDGKNRFDPAKDKLFADTQPLAKGSYYYRVIAINESGESASSNIQSFTQR